jgi:hypothetical protein
MAVFNQTHWSLLFQSKVLPLMKLPPDVFSFYLQKGQNIDKWNQAVNN